MDFTSKGHTEKKPFEILADPVRYDSDQSMILVQDDPKTQEKSLALWIEMMLAALDHVPSSKFCLDICAEPNVFLSAIEVLSEELALKIT